MNREQQRIEEFLRKKIDDAQLDGWKMPWIARAKCNFITGHPYQGGNAALVAFEPDEYFATFNQLQQFGHLNPGSKGLPIPFYKMMKDREDPDKVRPVMTAHYTVFGINNIEITNKGVFEGFLSRRKKEYNHKPLPEAEEFIKSIGADVQFDPARAYHTIGTNKIAVPKLDQFRNVEDYYRAIFHELGHWTGEKFACNRPLSGKHGAVEYAKEELVAEIYANYLAADFGLNLSEQSAAYVKSWLGAIREKPLALMKAFSEAQRAYKYTVDIISK
jgi:antirestriction protein ArdC